MSITTSMSEPARTWMKKPFPVQLAAAVDPRECAERRENCQVQAVQQHQGDQRNEDSDCAADGDVMVLVCRGNGEHLGQQLHGGFAPFVSSKELTTAALASGLQLTLAGSPLWLKEAV